MPAFARPAAWSYDLDLFRCATDDEDRLEAMLAAVALDDQGLWVVESNQRPAAFAWTTLERQTVRLLQLYVESGATDRELLPPLMQRIEDEYGGQCGRLVVGAESIQGVGQEALRAAGLDPDGPQWTKSFGATP